MDEYSEDMPLYSTRYEGKLEGVIGQIQANYFGVELYNTIEKKAAWLFYLLNKDHPFSNGNKRVAVMAYFVFLSANCKELYFDEETIENELFEIATLTAASFSEEIEEIIEMLVVKTKQYIHFK